MVSLRSHLIFIFLFGKEADLRTTASQIDFVDNVRSEKCHSRDTEVDQLKHEAQAINVTHQREEAFYPVPRLGGRGYVNCYDHCCLQASGHPRGARIEVPL
jgi:hypothetical protein